MEGIVVGIDESEGAAHALRFAVRESRLHGWPVTAILAWDYLSQHSGDEGKPAPFRPDYRRDDALEAARRIVARVVPEEAAEVRVEAVLDLPARALLDSSHGADLLVVGGRGMGGFRGLLLGSVSQQCAEIAEVPVAVVRALDRPATGGAGAERIVAGTDGSAASLNAVRWAHTEALRRGAVLDVVIAWRRAWFGQLDVAAPALDDASLTQTAGYTAERIIAELPDEPLTEPIGRLVVEGSPAKAILEAAAGADLIVIGDRGVGGFAGLRLGSTAMQVLHHAPCPVVVVPSRKRGA